MLGSLAVRAIGKIKQDPDPLIDGMIEGVDYLQDIVIALFGFFVVLGFLGLVYGAIRWKQR